MKKVARIAGLYTLVAAIATAVNLMTQMLSIEIYNGAFSIELSVLAGTAAGLPVKYVLEKKHIFQFQSDGLKHDGKLFFVYSFLGIFTTALFWGTEFSFQYIFGTDGMRYLGGAIGLIVGYIIKYHLDKRFVFVDRAFSKAGVV